MKVEELKSRIKQELRFHKHSPNYWGTEEEIKNGNLIYDTVLSQNIVTQEWFDDRLKATPEELYEELLNEV